MAEEIFNLKSVIEKWQVDYCPWVPAKRSGVHYPQVPFGQRKELITILVMRIRELGKEKAFFTNSRRDDIVKEIIPRGKHLSNTTINGFRDASKKMLGWIIEEVYANEEITKPKLDIEKPKEETKPITKEEEESDKSQLHLTRDQIPPITDTKDKEMSKFLGFEDDE